MTWGEGSDFETVKTFKCRGCGKELTCTANEAHNEHHWDVPPYFTLTNCSSRCLLVASRRIIEKL